MAERKLTVVQVLPALESGGVERGTLEVAAELARRGHRSIVISAGGRLVPELLAAGSEHIAWPLGRKSLLTLRYVRRLRRWLRAERIDVVHARSRLPAWMVYLAWRRMPVADRPHFITTVHGFYSVGRYSSIMTRGERVIAVSEAARDHVLSQYPAVNPARIVVIPRGVDRTHYAYGYRPDAQWLHAWTAQFPALGGKWLITLPGRITRLKGHQDFLSILDALRAQRIPVHGLVVGGYHARKRKYYQELQSRIEEQKLSEYVTFTGERADLREILAISDVVLSLSTQPESFGRTTLEALSLGRPVLGYAHGGVGEQLREVFPQGAVPPGDWQEASRRLAHWHRSPPQVEKAHSYTLQRMLDSTLALYQDVVSQQTAAVVRGKDIA